MKLTGGLRQSGGLLFFAPAENFPQGLYFLRILQY
ncbi:hypothetical protein BACCAP_00094 [Pseudoflavonifractor capillosus ATCC 29799]|uniref:Uncharacterized protein n=1 Tax=Pseudoflavonifractor capillosus ATCC 29799 TaxID=411467 RepID=A6NPH9_9FIRM|nr:hypothetical protein BACCAP_00094 [Pseudoflavonifractor capillosus ATCC 29799]